MVVKKIRVDCKCGHSFYLPHVEKTRWGKFIDSFRWRIKCKKCGKRSTETRVVEKKKLNERF